MEVLNLTALNLSAPYRVMFVGSGNGYSFVTDSGVLYAVSFVPDDMIRSADSYQFIIGNVNGKKSPRDNKLKVTILAIIEEFFATNQDALLYICETSDGKQKMRNRLFDYWFQACEQKGKYTMLSTNFVEDGEENYAAVIIKNDNPDMPKVMAEFSEAISQLSTKPKM